MRKLVVRILDRLGYIPKEKHHSSVARLQAEIKRIEGEKIDRLIESINTVNMVKAKLETPIAVYTFDEKSMPESHSNITYDYPPKSERFRIFVDIEANQLRRIYSEAIQRGENYELDYLIRSFLHKIQRDIEALMKIAL